MTHRHITRSIALAALVVLSVVAGSVGFAGNASAAASGLGIVSEQPAAGTGNVTVSVDVSEGANVSFKLEDADGTISATKTVADGGPADQAALNGTVETTLDLSRLFERPPESGTGIVYAGQGNGFSVPQQGYTSKVQIALDSDAPTAAVTSDAAAKAGEQVKIEYTATDVPQKVDSITMEISSNGTVHKTITGLQTGTDTGAQFTVPSTMSAGEYNATLVVVDEVGHRSTDMRRNALDVSASSDSGDASAAVNVGAMELVSSQPVNGTGNFSVTVATEETVSFKVVDSAGRVSATETVTDGNSEDRAETEHTVVTALNLSRLYDRPPASGTAVVYAANESDFSIRNQTFEDKRQFALDADRPTANLTHGDSAEAGQGVKVGYGVSDVPQKVSSVTLHIVGSNGTVYASITGLQGGTNREAQFTVPSALKPGEYNLTLVAVDEVGYRATDTLEDGLVVKSGSGSTAPLSGLTVVNEQPVAGTGNVTVRANADANASFKVGDATGTVSATETVTDGGPADRAPTSGVVETTLDLSALFERPPESGTGIVYASSGDGFSVPNGTFDDKQQITIDADEPTATVVTGASAEPGKKVRVEYTVTDVPQKVRSITISLVGPDGLIYERVPRLQAGKNNTAEFRVPNYMSAGEYDIRLVAVDEVGHRSTDTLENGFDVQSDGSSGETTVSVSSLDVVSQQPVKGTGDIVVRADISAVGANVSFEVRDAAGTVSATRTVTDGGSADRADRLAAVVETTLDLEALFESRPASGAAIVYAGGGDGFSIANQTYDIKRQVLLDADAPTANVTSGGSAEPGTQVKVGYRATDVPQKVSSVTLNVVGPDGNVSKTITGLQAGTGRTAQFVVPWDASPGEYNLTLVVVDEVGHRSTDTLEDGLVVTEKNS